MNQGFLLRVLMCTVGIGFVGGCQDSPSNRRGVSADGLEGESPSFSTPSQMLPMAASDAQVQQELSDFKSEFERYNSAVRQYLGEPALTLENESKVLSAHKQVLEDVVHKVAQEDESAYRVVLDNWKRVSVKGDFALALDEKEPWKELQTIGGGLLILFKASSHRLIVWDRCESRKKVGQTRLIQILKLMS